VDDGGSAGGPGLSGLKTRMAWSPSVGTVEPSDTESIESRESVKSRDTSPFQSPVLEAKPFQNYASTEVLYFIISTFIFLNDNVIIMLLVLIFTIL
jgi:hypothetical protein